MNRFTRRTLFGAAAGMSLAAPALAAYPDRTLRIISGYAPGGLNDIVSRAMAQALIPILGQAVVVENRPGANGSLGATFAARSAPDGHTLWMGIVDTQAINPFVYKQLQYDPETDFAPISLVAKFPFALVVGPSQPKLASFDALIAAARPPPAGSPMPPGASPARRIWRPNACSAPAASRCCTSPTPARRRRCRRSWPARWIASPCPPAAPRA